MCGLVQDLLDVGGDGAEVAVIVGRENVYNRLNGVMRDDGVADAAFDRGDAAENLLVRPLGGGNILELREGSHPILRRLGDDRV